MIANVYSNLRIQFQIYLIILQLVKQIHLWLQKFSLTFSYFLLAMFDKHHHI